MKSLSQWLLYPLLLLSNFCHAELSPTTGLFGEYTSLYDFYTADELVGGFYHHHCLFAEIPSFERPHAIFIYADRDGSFEIVHRQFSENIRPKMNQYFMRTGLDPHRAKSQMRYFIEHDISVETVAVDTSKQVAEPLIEQCSKVEVSFHQKEMTLDSSRTYFSSYMNSGFITGRPTFADENGLKSVKSKLFEIIQRATDNQQSADD